MKARFDSHIDLNILVIEDNPGDFFLIEEYIVEMFPLPVITRAKNFAEAHDLLTQNQEKFNSILLDVTLPDNNGLQLISDILMLADQLPVVILTGNENIDFSIHSVSLGVSEYLLKDELSAYALYKSILFSIERKKYTANIEESEKRYSELFRLSPVPMWVYDTATLQILNVNPAAIAQYGYTESEFYAMSVLTIFADFDDPAEFHQRLALENYSNIRHQLKDGGKIQVQIEQNFLTIDGRKCCIMLSNNITELIETESSLREAYKNIIEIEEKEKERFAGEIHDGLQQNIVAAKLIFSFLKEQSPVLADEPRAQLLNETLQSALDECSHLIREVRPKGITENGFYSEIEALIERIEATGNIDVSLSKQADLEQLFGYYNLMHIYRIVQELFNNALKYADANHLTLSFSIHGEELEIHFKDDGKGIEEDILSSKSSFMSLKRRVQILGATMKIKNKPAQGLVFKIKVPIVD